MPRSSVHSAAREFAIKASEGSGEGVNRESQGQETKISASAEARLLKRGGTALGGAGQVPGIAGVNSYKDREALANFA